MEEFNEDSDNSSAISENAEFDKLNINASSSGDINKNNNNKLKSKNTFDSNDINEEKSKKSYQSMFSFANISKSGDNALFDSDKNESSGEVDIRSSDFSNSNNNNQASIWQRIKQRLANFKNQIIFNYNIFTGLNNFNLNAPGLPKEIIIFDEKYSKQDEKLINKLKNIPWFSYRNDFDQIKEKDEIYTSDAGWGCMIRATQMILAQGIYKLYSMKDLESFINEYIAYFYDNKIPVRLLNKSKDDNNNLKIKNEKKENKIKEFNKNENEEIFDDFILLDPKKELRMSFIDISMEIIKGLENMTDRSANQKYITCPFSIRNFLKMQKKINANGKKVGQWFSNYDTVKLICEINKQMNENNDDDFKIMNFDDAAIYIEDIINQCFKEENRIEEYEGFENISNIYEDSEILLDEETINKDLKNKIYVFNKRRYEFNYKFILFVSIRHGLYELDQEMYDEIFKVFDIKTNIGIIGGKNSRAFYFIGKCGKNLIFLDPHFVQPTIPLNKFGTDSVQESYRPNDIYYMPINELSPSFSIGFAINSMKNFKIFMEKMKSPNYFIQQKEDKSSIIISQKTNLFIVKNWHYPCKKKI